MEYVGLQFVYDPNICNKVYWYYNIRFDLKVGDRVIAPIGVHDKLQCAKICKIVHAEGFDGVKFYSEPIVNNKWIRYVEMPYNRRRIKLSVTENTRELGGFFYDFKHITFFKRFLRSDAPFMSSIEADAKLSDYGVRSILDLRNEKEQRREESSWKGIAGIGYKRYPIEQSLTTVSLGTWKALFAELAESSGCTLFFSQDNLTVYFVSYILLSLSGVSEEDCMEDFRQDYRHSKDSAKQEADLRQLREILHILVPIDAETFLSHIGLSAKEIEKLYGKLTGGDLSDKNKEKNRQ